MNILKSSLIASAIALTLGATSVHAEDMAREGADRTVTQTVDDAAITAAVKAKLLADPRTEGFDINVDTKKGTVTLTGGADTQDDKKAAAELAGTVDGVILIDNQLVVAAEGTATRTEANTATASGEVRAAVTDADGDGKTNEVAKDTDWDNDGEHNELHDGKDN